MRRYALAFAMSWCACSPRAAAPPNGPAVVAKPGAPPVPVAVDEQCRPPETQTDPPGDDQMGPDSGDGIRGESGRTLDQKAELLDRDRPNEGVCDNRNRTDLERALAALPRPAPAKTARSSARGPLGFAPLVDAALGLTTDEQAKLARDGFVVPERLAYDNYASAYYDIFRGQLPVFVSVDSVMHAIYASHDQQLATLERDVLMPKLDHALSAMHCGLAAVARDYPADVAADVDLYLTVARKILGNSEIHPVIAPAVAEQVESIAGTISMAGTDSDDGKTGLATVTLFGRERTIDFTQYVPRGHYVDEFGVLGRYFKTAMWMSRTEMNLSSRDCRSSQPGYLADPSETPREAVVALALADVAARTGAAADLAAIDRAWTVLAGRREDVSVADLATLRKRAGIAQLTEPDAARKLRLAIGDGFVRTVNVHAMPNVPHLPVIPTLLGPRITDSTRALDGVISGRGPDHKAPEIAFVLGHDRAQAYVDRAIVPQLRDARAHLARAPQGPDLYASWLAAIRTLADRPAGTQPSFMDGAAYRDLRLDGALVAFGQLRHNHVLIEAQLYDQGGCEIPDGYVEPAPATYRALAGFAARAGRTFAELDPKLTDKSVAYYQRLERLMNVLASLSDEELAGHALSADAKRFLSMIVEMRPSTAFGYMGQQPIPTYNGWYVDMFPDIETAFHDAAFIADYATYDRNGQRGIYYLGAKGPRLGVFAVDVGGTPRVMVGPVAHGFSLQTPIEQRLDDSKAASAPGVAPWATSYALPAPAEPRFDVVYTRKPLEPSRRGPIAADQQPRFDTLLFDRAKGVGAVTIDLLDHHFVKIAAITATIGDGHTEVPIGDNPKVEAFRFRTASWQGRLDLDLEGRGSREFGKANSQ